MSPVAIAADKRFRRAHVRPARVRRRWLSFVRRGVVYGLTASVLVYGAHRATATAVRSRLFLIDQIVVHGNERLANGDVLVVLGGLRGQSLLWTDLSQWRQRLLSSPWIREVSLRRRLPSTVEVIVSERRPIGVGRLESRLYLVDEHGVIIDEYGPEHQGINLPIIDGLPAGGLEGAADGRRAALAARVIAAVAPNQEIARRLSQVDVRDPYNARVLLSGDTAVLQVGAERFLSRLESYLELAPALRERVPDIDYVDLRFDGRVYVRPASGRARRGSTSSRSRR